MADIDEILSQYGPTPQPLGGSAPLPDVRPREMRTPPLGQSNLVDRALSSFGQPSLDALREGYAGRQTPAQIARTFLETGPMGPFGMMAGRMARTADQAALRRAEEMATAGADRRAIWDETGWFQGVDGKWRFEIDDSAAAMRRSPQEFYDAETARYGHQTHETWLPNMVEHEELFRAYPELNNARFFAGDQTRGERIPNVSRGAYLGRDMDNNAMFGIDPAAGRSTMLHELQHGVQDIERTARGGAPAQFSDEATMNAAIRELLDRATAGMERFSPEAQAARDAVFASLNRDRDALGLGHALYRRLPGEVEARNVQTRADLTSAERRARPPWETQDTPDAEQILGQYGRQP